MEIKNKKFFNNLIKSLTLEIAKEDLDEMTATGNVAGYNTPNAFRGKKGKNKKKGKPSKIPKSDPKNIKHKHN